MKKTLKIELPDRATFLAGLTPRDAHPPLVRAEQAVSDGVRELEQRRGDLAARERDVVELPARIQRGEVKASALAEALRARDAAALLVPSAEAAVSKARERVGFEERNAVAAVEREFARRVEQIERAAAEVEPALAELRALADELAGLRGAGAVLGSVEWTCSPNCNARQRMQMHGGVK